MERNEQMQKKDNQRSMHRRNDKSSDLSPWLYVGGGAALVAAAAIFALNLPDLKRYIKMSRM